MPKTKVTERKTIRRIREAISAGNIPPVFGPKDVDRALSIRWAGTFLPKHRVGNPGGNTELFIQVDRGLYKLRDQWLILHTL
ncbi:MAG: hypothetical protein ACRD22_05190 [Terriglobia bacterium]